MLVRILYLILIINTVTTFNNEGMEIPYPQSQVAKRLIVPSAMTDKALTGEGDKKTTPYNRTPESPPSL